MWDTNTGFCFVTFTEHTGSVTGVAFTQSGKALLSSSLDGTVRAFDMARYRNFRTFTSPKPAQFSCLTVDACADLIAAGAQDTFDVYLWSLQTGKLLEIFRSELFGCRQHCKCNWCLFAVFLIFFIKFLKIVCCLFVQWTWGTGEQCQLQPEPDEQPPGKCFLG